MSTAEAARVYLRGGVGEPGTRVAWHCPGCGRDHLIVQDKILGWSWNGDLVSPTIRPSVLVRSHKTLVDETLEGDALTNESNITEIPMCHSFVTDGQIWYLHDSTHEMAGQTVPVPPWAE